ncbi:hypothetical protein VNI00_004639 [Paramarasmius palmivorus]|uniref:F-box domain-containing protein n=1 Tax=Paramarasmius palmivorus TaxID=297713 RepID=A0AAW0DJN2_9AGAR
MNRVPPASNETTTTTHSNTDTKPNSSEALSVKMSLAHNMNETNHLISRFPNELLCKTFEHSIESISLVRSECLEPLDDIPEKPFALTLSHVCRRWRTIAIGFPSLWTLIDFSTPELANEMLKRSGQAPLHIRYIHFEHSFKTHERLSDEYVLARMEALSQALSHRSRLQTIQLDIPSAPMEALAARHTEAAPSLWSLHINSSGCDLPPEFLGGGAPLLTDLFLNGCGLAHSSPLLHNLKSLRLMGGYETSFEEDLCDVLMFMPALEYLDLEDIRFDDDDDDSDDTPIVNLSKLRQLDLERSELSCSKLFKRISFPGTASVAMDIYSKYLPDMTETEELNEFWADIARALSPDDPGQPGQPEAWNTVLPFNYFSAHSSDRPNISVKITWAYENPPFFEELLGAAFNTLRFPEVESMHLGPFPLDGSDNVLTTALMPHIRSMSLRTLILSGTRCAECLPALLLYEEDDLPLPLPELETLGLVYPGFESGVDDLYDSLEVRLGEGKKLKKLVVLESESLEGMSDLRKVVDEVEEVCMDGDSSEVED